MGIRKSVSVPTVNLTIRLVMVIPLVRFQRVDPQPRVIQSGFVDA